MKRLLILPLLILAAGCEDYSSDRTIEDRTFCDTQWTCVDDDPFGSWEDTESVGKTKNEHKTESVKVNAGEVQNLDGRIDDFIRSADVTVVEWSASWCGPCQTLKPKLTAMAQEFADSGVVFGSADYDTLKAEADGVSTLPRTRVYQGAKLTAEIEGDNPIAIKKAVRDALGQNNNQR